MCVKHCVRIKGLPPEFPRIHGIISVATLKVGRDSHLNIPQDYDKAESWRRGVAWEDAKGGSVKGAICERVWYAFCI